MANKIKGLLVDVTRKKAVKVVEFEDTLENIYKLLDVELIDVACRKVGNHIYDFIVDDEGLLKENAIPSALDSNGKPMLVGNLFVVNSDDYGNFASLTDEQIDDLLYHTVVISFIENGEKRKVLAGVEYE